MQDEGNRKDNNMISNAFCVFNMTATHLNEERFVIVKSQHKKTA
jgi:hypothetical protein